MEQENERRKLKKKSSLIYILRILEKYSHEDNPLTHEDIAGYLLEDYDIELERKAISRCIDALEDAGYSIERPHGKGTYLDTSSGLEDVQVQLMLDSVLANRTLSSKEAKKLIDFLLTLGSAGVREKNWNIFSLNTWGKSESNSAHYSMDEINRAIRHRRQIKFMYDDYVYGLHHSLYGLNKDSGKDAPVFATPIRILPKNGYEYLVAIIEWEPKGEREYRIECFRLDLIRSAEETKELAVLVERVPGYEKGFDPQAFLTAYPTMTTGYTQPITVKFAYQGLDEDLIRQYLGKDAWIRPAENAQEIKSKNGTDWTWKIATAKMGAEEAVRLALRHHDELILIHPEAAMTRVRRALHRTEATYQWAEKHFNHK